MASEVQKQRPFRSRCRMGFPPALPTGDEIVWAGTMDIRQRFGLLGVLLVWLFETLHTFVSDVSLLSWAIHALIRWLRSQL